MEQATWLSKNDPEGRLESSDISSSVSLVGNESRYFVLMQIDRDNNLWASRNMTEQVGLLDVGRWTAEITVSSDTCESLHGDNRFYSATGQALRIRPASLSRRRNSGDSVMEHIYRLEAPLLVDVGIGDNWRDAK